MKVFILRARKGPTSAGEVRKTMGYPHHFEVIAHSLVSALFISKNTRTDVVFYVVLEGNPHPPLIISFFSRELEPMNGFDENAIASVFERVLKSAPGLNKGSRVRAEPGIYLHKRSFESLVKELSKTMPLFWLDRKGRDLREITFPEICGFIFTDHIPMQRKTLNLLTRLGVTGLSLGPKMLFAAHCISIVHNELDRQE